MRYPFNERLTRVTCLANYIGLSLLYLQFVAHPHCQQLLASIWYEGLPGWRKRNFVSKVIIIVGLILLMPFMAIYYLILPRSRVGQILRTPFMKFMYHSASFGVFLFLLILASTNVSTGSADQKARQRQRGPPPTQLEWLIVFWVTGKCVLRHGFLCSLSEAVRTTTSLLETERLVKFNTPTLLIIHRTCGGE